MADLIEHLWHFWVEPQGPNESGVLCSAAGFTLIPCRRADCETRPTLHITNDRTEVTCPDCDELIHA